MKLNLERPLVIFDLETTGLDIANARIIQVSYIIAYPDGSEKRANLFINPECPIPPEVVELTHITNDMVKDAPTFKQMAHELAATFKGCDFCGFNSNNFDIPLLAEEFLRAGVNFDFRQAHLIDVCSIFKQMERRNLAAAYEFYCGRKMEDDFQAHLADQDTEATWRVLQAQLDMYSPEKQDKSERVLANNVKALADLSSSQRNVDLAGRIVYNDKGEEVINFGKHKGRTVKEVAFKDRHYFDWIQGGEFTRDTKHWFETLRLKYAGR